jgi:CHASE2 domain-containing sensor protein
MRRPVLLSERLALALLAVGVVLFAAAWIVFGFEPALAVLVVTLTAATAATIARLTLTDDPS